MNQATHDGARPESGVAVRPAATVMLVRDAPRLEVLMLERNEASVFVGGAHVFPGGAVDPADHHFDGHPVCPDLDDAEASRRLGLTHGGLAYWVAAVRECFEEAGVLLARRSGDGSTLDLDEPGEAQRFAAHRQAVDRGRRSMLDVLVDEDLVLDAAALHPVSRWITPEGAPRRYDTRFFVAHAPPAQPASPDDREAVRSEWLAPMEALDRYARGEIELIVPTVASLEMLAEHDDAASAVAAWQVPAASERIADARREGSGVRA